MSSLGIYDGHNAGAALIGSDGTVTAAVEEERFSRIKNHDARPAHDPLPVESVAYCVDAAGTDVVTSVVYGLQAPDDLERVAMANFDARVAAGQTQRLARADELGLTAEKLRRLPLTTQRDRVAGLRRLVGKVGLGGLPEKFVDHHTAHAAGAFLLSGARDALVITLDGKGDDLSGSVSIGTGGTVDRTLALPTEDSIGHLYSAFTVACGLRPQRDEGKLQAMAADGVADPGIRGWLDELYRVDPQTGAIRGRLGDGLVVGPYPDRPAHLHNDRVRERIEGLRPVDAAATVQLFVEDLVVAFARWHLDRSGQDTLVLAGGVFANVSLNRRLGELSGLRTLHVHPAMTDAGIALGAAASAHGAQPLADAYLGPAYPDEEAARAFAAEGFHIVVPDAPAEHALAAHLAAGAVAARFVGRAEYGPRALGHRSILAPARDPRMPEILNGMLRRSTVMPFAPLARRTDAALLFDADDALTGPLGYMTVAVPCTPHTRTHYPAITHRDGTARPQLVDGGRLGVLLSELERLNGDRVVINTSYNLHDEPMVCRPADAARTARIAGITMVQVGGLLAVVSGEESPR